MLSCASDATDLRVDLVVIRNVVSMRAAWRRGEVRGGVTGADAEPGQVGDDCGRLGQGKVAMDLEAICAPRHVPWADGLRMLADSSST